jgi:hypothetical protein
MGLSEQGFSVAAEDSEKGSLTTTQKVVSTTATGNAYSATATEVSHAYKVLMTDDGENGCEVRVEPMVFVNGERQGLGDLPYWKKRWNALFDSIEANL